MCRQMRHRLRDRSRFRVYTFSCTEAFEAVLQHMYTGSCSADCSYHLVLFVNSSSVIFGPTSCLRFASAEGLWEARPLIPPTVTSRPTHHLLSSGNPSR